MSSRKKPAAVIDSIGKTGSSLSQASSSKSHPVSPPEPPRRLKAGVEHEKQDVSARDFVFDPWNIRILVTINGKVVEGKVASYSLSQVSPVWKRLLFPPRNEDSGELRHTVKRIDCSNDDSEALLVLLNICHNKHTAVAQTLPYELLLEVALLCDRYQCVEMVRTWLTEAAWLRDEAKESRLAGREGWFRISQVFGLDITLEKLVRHVARNATKLERGRSSEALTLVPDDLRGKQQHVQQNRINICVFFLQIGFLHVARQ